MTLLLVFIINTALVLAAIVIHHEVLFQLSKRLSLAKKIAQDLRKNYMVEFDDSGAIGRRYRRADEIGYERG